MNITGIQDELLRIEHPRLPPDHDPDIERYFYLRSTNRDADAIIIYRARLVPRYPNNEFRTWLLRAYRSHDPAFPALLAKGREMLALRLLERIKAVIQFIAEKAESLNEKDVYSTIKTAEGILRILPPDRYEAMSAMERYQRYAAALDLRERSVAKANELVQAYLTDNLSVVKEERQRRSEAEHYAREQERQRLIRADYDTYLSQKEKTAGQSGRKDERRSVSRPAARKAPLIDLSSIVFSQQDLARIEIPPLRRVEDQTLAYCVKYWNMIYDSAFERILFLYSRKYGKKNYDVFMTIRRGRTAKRRDDEILSSIVSLLITGYYYSIKGDAYLLRSWNAVKEIVEKQAAQTRPGASRPARPSRKAVPAFRPAAPQTMPVKIVPAVPVDAATAKTAYPVEIEPTAAPQIPPVNTAPVSQTSPGKTPSTEPAQSVPQPKPAQAVPVPREEEANSSARQPAVKGSVSDRLKELSGRSYDVYQDRFFAKSRGAIRKVIGKKKGLFVNLPEEAENLVFGFLRGHYSDPFMNWEDSAERRRLLAMGFDLPSIIPVIDECYKTL
jgi:hypothetical protein